MTTTKLCAACTGRLQEDQLHAARATIGLFWMRLDKVEAGTMTVAEVREWLRVRSDRINTESERRVLAGCSHVAAKVTS